MTPSKLEIKLQIWGEWVNNRLSGVSLGYSSESTEYRMMRTAAPPDRLKQSGWVCCDCGYRHDRQKHPRYCEKCGSHHLYSSPHVCTGVEKRKHHQRKEMLLPDNAEAERLENMIAQLHNWKYIHMLRLIYVEGYSVRQSVDYVDWGRSKCQSLLDGAKESLINMINTKVGMTD